jgi:hypothetical protein
LIIQDNVSALISTHRIPDVLKEIKNLKIGRKWTIMVETKAEGMEGYPSKLERLLMLHLVKMISRRAVLRQAQDRAENAEKIFSTLRSLRL